MQKFITTTALHHYPVRSLNRHRTQPDLHFATLQLSHENHHPMDLQIIVSYSVSIYILDIPKLSNN